MQGCATGDVGSVADGGPELGAVHEEAQVGSRPRNAQAVIDAIGGREGTVNQRGVAVAEPKAPGVGAVLDRPPGAAAGVVADEGCRRGMNIESCRQFNAEVASAEIEICAGGS